MLIRKVILVVLILLFENMQSYSQPAEGSTAPDFTLQDINGNTHNLYSYLDSGKYVAIEVSATWCVPCWNYHSSKVMDSLYTFHDNPGDKTWKVLFIEGYNNSTLANLQGAGSSQGDWITGTPFPIMNPSGVELNDFMSAYNVNGYPTLMLICPDKVVRQSMFNTGPKPFVNKWESVASNSCAVVGIEEMKNNQVFDIYPNPATKDINLYFKINNDTEVELSVFDLMGQSISTKKVSGINSENQPLKYDVSNLRKGIYFFNITTNTDRYRRKIIVE